MTKKKTILIRYQYITLCLIACTVEKSLDLPLTYPANFRNLRYSKNVFGNVRKHSYYLGHHDDEHEDDNFPSKELQTNAQQFLSNDVLEIIIKLRLFSFLFMRINLKAVNRFFRATVDREPFPIIYIPEFPAELTTICVRSIITLKGKRSGAVIRLKEIINSPRWHVAWLKLRPQSYGWFAIRDIHWKK